MKRYPMTQKQYDELYQTLIDIIHELKNDNQMPSEELQKAIHDSYYILKDSEITDLPMEEVPELDSELIRSLLEKQVEWDNEREGFMNLEDGIECDCCKNKGRIFYLNENNEEVTKNCECMDKRMIIRALVNNKLDESKQSLDNFKCNEKWQLDVLNQAREFVKYGRNWFFIGGQVGSGKTKLCNGIIVEMLKQRKSCHIMNWRADSIKIKQAKSDSIEYDRLMDKLKKVDYLYIDDFLKCDGDRKPTDADIELAYDIIEYRYKFNKPTIISSEQTMETLYKLSPAIAGRINERCGQYAISIENDTQKDVRINQQLLLS